MIFETKKNVRSIDRLFSIVCCATDVCILLRRENQNQNKKKKIMSMNKITEMENDKLFRHFFSHLPSSLLID